MNICTKRSCVTLFWSQWKKPHALHIGETVSKRVQRESPRKLGNGKVKYKGKQRETLEACLWAKVKKQQYLPEGVSDVRYRYNLGPELWIRYVQASIEYKNLGSAPLRCSGRIPGIPPSCGPSLPACPPHECYSRTAVLFISDTQASSMIAYREHRHPRPPLHTLTSCIPPCIHLKFSSYPGKARDTGYYFPPLQHLNH